jgi:hypothetical protein
MRIQVLSVALVTLGAMLACSAPPGDDGAVGGSASISGQTCTNGYYTQPAANGVYYATDFGCSIAADGSHYTDPGDNCIPACLSTAQQSICAGMSGPDCEDAVTWYSADAARFGCMARLRVTNPANGKVAILAALDYGPGCSVEDNVDHAVLDMSQRAIEYLFGEEEGSTDRASVDVVAVASDTPLGPVTATTQDAGAADSATTPPPPTPDAGAADTATTPDAAAACPVLTFPSGISLQTYPDATTSATYADHLSAGQTAPLCFIDTNNLLDPVANTTYDLTVNVATHFELEELVGTEVSEGYGHFVLVSPPAVASLEAFRESLDVPVTINSGFRSPKHQEAVCEGICGDPLGCAGTCANNSRHLWGDAFDLPLSFYTTADENLACTVGFKFAYLEAGTHLHIDQNPAYATCVTE